MMDIAEEMFRDVNAALWRGDIPEVLRSETFKRDIRLNKLERSVRRRVINHLATHGPASGDTPYCLVLMNVVKDAERIGDYVKNLAEIPVISSMTIPEGDLRTELRDIGFGTESLLAPVARVFRDNRKQEAEHMIRTARELSHRADGLLPRIANADYPSRATTSLCLTARFYKRITGHTCNILSSVVMPVHKIDYFDEKELDASN